MQARRPCQHLRIFPDYNNHKFIEQTRNLDVTYILRIVFTISTGKLFHKPVDFLCLARQSEPIQEKSQGAHKVLSREIQLVHVGVHDFLAEYFTVSEEIPQD